MDIRHILSPLKGRNTQVLMKNFSSLAILQVLRYLIPLIVLPYVTPIIGLEHFGDIAISASFTLIVQVFVSYSFSFMGARDIARNLGDMGVISRIVSNTLTAYVFTYLLILPFAACIIYLIPKFRSIWLLMAINLLSPLFSAFVCEWFFQGIEQMQNITIVNAISRIVFIILVFTFIKNESDYLLYPLFEVIT